MKKINLLLSTIMFCGYISAQSEFDAIKFLQNDIIGTARYTSMAGAFGALGGDPSAIKDNPAGLGIYRSSEISGTLGLITQNTNAKWNDISDNKGMTKMPGNSLSYIISVPSNSGNKGLVRSNWAFNYNRVKDFSRELRIKGGSQSTSSGTDYYGYFTGNFAGNNLYIPSDNSYDPFNNTSVPWISVLAANAGVINEYVDNQNNTLYWNSLLNGGEKVTPTYYSIEQGYMDLYSVSWAGNINNRLFLGASLNLYDLYYKSESEYQEIFGSGGDYSLYNFFESEGKAVGFKIGAIYLPVEYVRLGLSLQTPVKYVINDTHYADMNYYFNADDNGVIESPTGSNNYKLNTPMTLDLSGAFILGNKGVIGIEYQSVNASNTEFTDASNNKFNFRDENDTIKSLFNNHDMLKIGVEYKLTSKISVRGGYAVSNPVNSDKLTKLFLPNTIRTDTEYFLNEGTSYVSGGIGYRESNWYIDFALVNKTTKELFYPYNTTNLNLKVNPATLTNNYLSLNATVGFKF